MGCSPAISVSDPFPGSLCLPLEGELESCLAGDLLPYGRLSTSGTLWKYHLKPWLVTNIMQTLAVGISSSSISLLSLSLTCRQCLPVFPFHLQQQLARGHWQHSQLSPVALVLKTQTHLLLAQSHLLRLRIGDYDQVQLMEINLQLQLGWLNFVAH